MVITNNAVVKGYLWYFRLTGDALFMYDPIDYETSDSGSISSYRERELRIDAVYQENINTVKDIADAVLGKYKDAADYIDQLTYKPQANATLEAAFMNVQIGKRIAVVETVTGTNAEYFVNGWEYI